MSIKKLSLAIMLAASSSVSAEVLNHANTPEEFASKLFTGSEQYSNFYRIEEILSTDKVAASASPKEWPMGEKVNLPEQFTYDGRIRTSKDLIEQTETAALLVIKDGKIRYENYWLTGGQERHWLSMSVSKSLTSILIGIAVTEGKIQTISDPASKYVPTLKGSAYENVSIKDILQMSSGASWSEDYANPDSEISRLSAAMAGNSSFLHFAASVKSDLKPGTVHRYNSADTLILGLVLEAATGKSMAQYTQEKLWEPLGAEKPGYWVKDNEGHTMAFGGFNATARDYAKLGELYRLNGVFNGKQIIPAEWVNASITPDAPHLMPGKRETSESTMGYGYQWWIPEGNQKDFSAIGVYNQFIYVNPEKNTVIVKLSASRNYASKGNESSWRENETIELFRAIANSID